MTNWAIGQGYLGLASAERKKESLKEEFATMKMMTEELRQEKADKEADQLKEQAYHNEVSKFADTLLAPDRDKINQRAKMLATKVRENIKAYGGDMGKFFENGGHQILADYKSSIIGSPESSIMLENKKNMELIIKAQDKGFTINPRDEANLKQYQKTGEGKITYSGLMQDIEMPELSGYRAGEEIPIEKIIGFKSNRAKIMANYMMTFPDRGVPHDQELKSFALTQYNVNGANTQMEMQEKSLAQTAKLQTMEMTSREKIEAAKLQQQDEHFKYGLMAKESQSSSGKNSGGGASASAEVGAGAPGYVRYYTTEVSDIVRAIPTKGLTMDKINSNWIMDFGKKNMPDAFKNAITGEYKIPAKDLGDKGDGNIFEITSQSWTPRSAAKLNHKPNAVMKAITGMTQNENGTFTTTITKETQWFDAAGNRIDQYTDTNSSLAGFVNAVTTGGNIFNDYFTMNDKPKNLTTRNVILAPVQIGKDGTETMIMDAVNTDGSPNEKLTKEYNERAKGSNGQYGEVQFRAFVVAESDDEKKQRFFIPYDPTISKNQSDINEAESSNDITKENQANVQSTDERRVVENRVKYTEEVSNNFWSQADQDPTSSRTLQSEAGQYYPNGNPSRSRDNFIKAFYGTIADNNHSSGAYVQGIQDRAFTRFVNEFKAQGYKDIVDDLSSTNVSNNEINLLERMKSKDPENAMMYERWKAQYQYLQKRK